MERILRSKTEPIKHGFNSLGQFMWSRLQRLEGQSVCVIDATTDEHLTVSELKSRAKSIAMALIERGINKTDIIAFSGQNSIQHLVLRFATYFMGNTYAINFNPFQKDDDVESMMKTIGANVIMCSANDFHIMKAFIANIKHSIKHTVVFDGRHDNCLSYDQLVEEGRDERLTRIPHFDVSAEDIAYIAPSSGSTGIPKIALFSHRMLLNAVNMRVSSQTSKVIFGVLFSMRTISGSNYVLYNVVYGNTIILLPGVDQSFLKRSYDLESIFKAIASYRIHIMYSYSPFAPILLEAMDSKKYDLSSIKSLRSGGNFFSSYAVRELNDKHGVKFVQSYGMAEYTAITQNTDASDDYLIDSVGPVSPGTELKIIDLTTGECLGAGIDGEIYVRGNKLFSGYLDNDGAYRELFDSEGWLKSGDIGHYDDKERLFLKGRLKNIINVYVDNQCKRVFPEEIEDLLLSHKSIVEVVVIGVDNRNGYQWPRAYVRLRPGHTVSAESIQQMVSESLFSDKQLKAGVVFVDRIERTITEKLSRKYYRDLVRDEVVD